MSESMAATEGVAAALLAEDSAARERALDCARSFLVQAPAGSGKTGLLIQRFLALLGRVDRPERIVAMTFTRKAAGEMRSRIVEAMREARDDAPVDGEHEARTRALARAALEHDERSQWHLLDHPARLRIVTIDAFATALARAAPIASGLGGSPDFVEDALPLYAGAIREALHGAPPDDPAWLRLLRHFANDAQAVVDVLAQLLAKRDELLARAVDPDRAALRAHVEAGLAAECLAKLAPVPALFPRAALPSLASAERYAAGHLAASGNADSSELAAHLRHCADHGGIPPVAAESVEAWRALASWLLTNNSGGFRQKFDVNNGFPPKGKGPGSAERDAAKQAMNATLAALSGVAGLAEALATVRVLPTARHSDAAWEVVEAVLALLPRVTAQLHTAHATTGTFDFPEATLAALRALGEPDAPGDLLLRLDLAIGHLLIDEFQDTSFVQLRLVERLTAGWQPGDGRTLFVVGDPMQSIYRFRNAEVANFVEAQQERKVADVPVECLSLYRNFRSQAGLVEWVNREFPAVLGTVSDPWEGRVAFAPATAFKDALPGEPATLEIAPDALAEAELVVARAQDALRAPGSVAILVRTRTALGEILPALRRKKVPYAEVDLDALGERRAILDLAAMTRALLQPADRLAWLATARAPWCGLTLADLLALATAAPEPRSLAALADAPEVVEGLSDDGRARWEGLARVMRTALAARGRTRVAPLVRGAWLALGGPATLVEEGDLDSAERYFALVAAHEQGGDLPDWPAFGAALARLRTTPQGASGDRVQVMTLHKAKGLEFDTVIVPGLASRPRDGEAPLLRWRQRRPHWLLAPAPSRHGGEDRVYDYLKALNATEETAELGRLLYVGCTRAQRRLHLIARLRADLSDPVSPSWKAPRRGTALKLLEPLLVRAAPPVASAAPPPTEAGARPLPLARLPSSWSAAEPAAALAARPRVAAPAEEPLPFDWVREAARHVGTVAHRVFREIARDGIAAWDSARAEGLAPRLRVELRELGVGAAELDGAVAQAIDCVRGLLASTHGRFAFDPRHGEAASEWALAGVDAGEIVHVTLDRTFVAAGERWIVDFKTGAHEGGDLDAFLDAEAGRYRQQLERYARIVRGLDERPIRLALFHPRVGGWREWRYAG